MIAASKMRRAQQMVLASRPYADEMNDLLSHLSAQPLQVEDSVHPLLMKRPVKHIAMVLITTDRGLCGGLNANLNRTAGQHILSNTSIEIDVLTVGKKGRDFMVRSGRKVSAVFADIGDKPTILDVAPIARLVMDNYRDQKTDQVLLVYPRFVNTVVQRPVVQKLLPVEPAQLKPQEMVGYIYEPDPKPVLDALLPRFVEMQIYHAMLELVASEQSARMVAMRNATDNAKDMINSLTLLMNKIRQDTITKELLDIVGGAVSLG